MKIPDEEMNALKDEYSNLIRKTKDADQGIGPAIGEKLREQMQRRMLELDSLVNPDEPRFVDAPRSPWQR